MDRCRTWRTVAALFALAAWGAGCLPALGQPVIRIEEKDKVTLRFWPLTVGQADEPDASRTLEIEGDTAQELQMELPWPDAASPSQLLLKAARQLAPAAGGVLVRLEAELTAPDGQVVRSNRELAFDESTTALYEVARIGDRPLTLAIEATRVQESVATARPTVGPPVQLHLEVQRIEGERAVSLETNRLSTFVGEPVMYSFRLGETGDAESVRVQLLPLQVLDDLVRIEIEVSANLPGEGDEPLLLSRKEQWATTRGATSSLAVETGEPPKGYRFLVTPQF